MMQTAGNPSSAAWLHAHPVAMSVAPLIVIMLIITAVVLASWLTSKSAWAYHPGGSSGFLRDEILRYASIWLPFAVVMVGVRYYVYQFHPELSESPYMYVLYLSVFVFRRLARLLPHVQEIGKRIDLARGKARAAKDGVHQ